jgi:hypothetical protein
MPRHSNSLPLAELSTLFTTPQERQIINSNRYRSDEVKPVRPVEIEQAEESPVQLLIQEEVTHEYMISGITISREGPHLVWINAQRYEDGEQIEGDVRIKVLADDEIMVRFTAPDGKHYYATSGQTLEVTYLARVEN